MKKLLILTTVLFLSACATLAPEQTHFISWPKREAHLEKIKCWDATGSLSIATRDHVVFANFHWQQQNDQYTILLESPLDLVAAKLIGNAHSVSLQNNNKPPVIADSPDDLVQMELGWQLPMTPLAEWIRGIPAPHLPYQLQLDAAGRLQILQQAGWNIEFLQYQRFENDDRPTLIQLTRPGLRVKIKLRWVAEYKD